jgi:hypothetical protein
MLSSYARRYALFTLVGIAGEDDLDAPDLPISNLPAAPVNGTVSGKTNGRAEAAPNPYAPAAEAAGVANQDPTWQYLTSGPRRSWHTSCRSTSQALTRWKLLSNGRVGAWAPRTRSRPRMLARLRPPFGGGRKYGNRRLTPSALHQNPKTCRPVPRRQGLYRQIRVVLRPSSRHCFRRSRHQPDPFKSRPTALTRAPSLSWSRAAIATSITSASSRANPAQCAAGSPRIRIMSDLLKGERWAAKYRMSSLSRCVESTTASFIAKVTKPHGGRASTSIHYRSHLACGSTRVVYWIHKACFLAGEPQQLLPAQSIRCAVS